MDDQYYSATFGNNVPVTVTGWWILLNLVWNTTGNDYQFSCFHILLEVLVTVANGDVTADYLIVGGGGGGSGGIGGGGGAGGMMR